ncbi:hypothetical protein GXW82_36825 [Streptacidiphilus sp. 4-A2]|nr:hypothetical protein [Streptacidiphilus sp. 4-A2]
MSIRAVARAGAVAQNIRKAGWAAPDQRVFLLPALSDPRLRYGLAVVSVACVSVLTETADSQLNLLVPGSLAWALAGLQVLPLLLAAARPLAAWRSPPSGWRSPPSPRSATPPRRSGPGRSAAVWPMSRCSSSPRRSTAGTWPSAWTC